MKPYIHHVSSRPRLSQNINPNIPNLKTSNSLAYLVPIKTKSKIQKLFPNLLAMSISTQNPNSHYPLNSQTFNQTQYNHTQLQLDQYQKLTTHYQKQNINLKSQNEFLLQSIRQQKRKQKDMNLYINKLQQKITQYQLLQRIPQQNFTFISKYIEPSQKQFNPVNKIQDQYLNCKQNLILTNTKQNTISVNSQVENKLDEKSTTHQIQYQSHSESTIDKLQGLNSQFHKLIEQCIKQKTINKKQYLRKSLAGLAGKIKIVRQNLLSNKS